MIFLQALWARVWPYIVVAGAVLTGLFAVRQSGKSAGKQEAKVDQLEADMTVARRARNVENETASMADDDIADELIRDWVRDGGR